MHTMSRCFRLLGVVALFAGGWCNVWAAAGGSAGGNFDMPTAQMTPEDQAKQAYNSGIKKLKDAVEYEEDARKATEPKKVAKAQEKAHKAYERALKDFNRATEKMPTMHEAWNYVGYTQRHLGQYDSSLAAYAKALELKPNYPEALEYRGEAFLGLNALEDAKQTYLALSRTSPLLAKQLMSAMRAWVDQRRKDPSGIEPHTVDGFATWIKEREAVAGQSASPASAERG